MGSPRSQKKEMKELLGVLTKDGIHDTPSWRVEAMGQTSTMHLIIITPEEAEQIIEWCNLRNRKVRQNKVLEYARSMSIGDWQLIGALVFTTSGELLDGQHRILAVAESGVTVAFKMDVINARAAVSINRFLDIGPPRNLADYLHFNEVPNSHRTSPILVYERNAKITNSPLQSSRGEKQDYLELYQDITEEPFKKVFEIMPRGLHTVLGINRAFLDWFALRLVQFDLGSAELFLGLLSDCSQLKKSDAPYVLRESLMELQRKNQKISLVQQAHMTAKAWRFYSEGQPTTSRKIKHRPNEDWPGILGDPNMEMGV